MFQFKFTDCTQSFPTQPTTVQQQQQQPIQISDNSHSFNNIQVPIQFTNYTQQLNTCTQPISKSPQSSHYNEDNDSQIIDDDQHVFQSSSTTRYCGQCHTKSLTTGHYSVCKPIDCNGLCSWSNCPVKKQQKKEAREKENEEKRNKREKEEKKKEEVKQLKESAKVVSGIDVGKFANGIMSPGKFMEAFTDKVKPILDNYKKDAQKINEDSLLQKRKINEIEDDDIGNEFSKRQRIDRSLLGDENNNTCNNLDEALKALHNSSFSDFHGFESDSNEDILKAINEMNININERLEKIEKALAALISKFARK